ncbi:MAG: hypothetical protein Kow0027_26700 [Saprospiraceae bacterium]
MEAQTRAKKKSDDFIPGDKVIFLDSLKSEQLGEFPSRRDLKSGTAEVMEMDGHGVIGFVASQSVITPLMDRENWLPEIFTVEFDVYFHNRGNEAYTLMFDNGKMDVVIRNSAIKFQGTLTRSDKQEKPKVGWQHVAVSFNQRAYKVYLNGEKLLNAPAISPLPKRLEIKALSHNTRYDKYAMVANVRIAEGGVPLYDRLVTNGRFVTNDIHFDYNQATLRPSSRTIIEEVIEMMKAHPELKLSIEGHTDSDGAADYNLALSEKRAAAVKAAIVDAGIEAGRLNAIGYGEEKPIMPNHNPEAKAANRRVEFVLLN